MSRMMRTRSLDLKLNLLRRFGVLLVPAFCAFPAVASDMIPLLKAGSQSYTNAIIEDVTPTLLFIRHNGGMSTVSLKELDPDLQRRFGYVPGKINEGESYAHYSASSATGSGKDASSGKNEGVEGTNDLTKLRIQSVTKDYPIGNQGALALTFPSLWKDSVQSATTEGAQYVSIRFEPRYASNVVVLVTSLPAKSKLKEMGPRNALEMAARPLLAGSEQSRIELNELSGIQTSGLYFTVSDKRMEQGPQKSGGHKFQTQGFVNIDDFALSFVILYDYPESMEMRAAMQIIQTARFKRPE